MSGGEEAEVYRPRQVYLSQVFAARPVSARLGPPAAGDAGGHTPTADILARRSVDCVALEARIRRFRRALEPLRIGDLVRALADAQTDLETYAGLLTERAAQLGPGRPDIVVPLRDQPADDVPALAAGICDFVRRTRGAQQAAERLGDPESAGLLAELARVAETWLWGLEAPARVVPLPTALLVAR